MAENILLLSNRVKFRREKEKWIIVTPGGKLLLINDVARLVLQYCDGSHFIDDIHDKLLRVMDIEDGDRLRNDIKQFLVKMEKTGCVFSYSTVYEEPSVEVVMPGGTKDLNKVAPKYFLSHTDDEPST